MMPLDPALALTVALLLAGVLAVAAVSKLAAPGAFAGVMRNYRLLPEPLVEPLALALPIAELVVAMGLLVPATRSEAATAAVALLLLFAAAMAINLWRGRSDIDCGCFVGLVRQRIDWVLVHRNLALSAGGAFLILGEPMARHLTFLDWVTVATATGSLAFLYAAVGRLFGTAPITLTGAR